MAGLCAALALAPTGRDVVVLERDAAPPSGDPDEIFEQWARRGAGQIRHSHAFLARFRAIIRADHPTLHAKLLHAGARELGLEGMLTDLHRRTYHPAPADGEFVVLTARRTTMALTIRRYVERLPNVRIASETFVRRLLLQDDPEGLRVVGVSVEDADGGRDIIGDIVVDASGRNSPCVDQLREAGASVAEESEDAEILYFTRHYRLLGAEPPRGTAPTTGDLGYLKFGLFPGEQGRFSITLCVHELEAELRKALVDPAQFDAVCARLPGLATWVLPETAAGSSRVFGMGDLRSRWRDFAVDGAPAALGYFPIGDALIRSNPLYGRGCAFAAVGAYLLRDVLVSTRRPAERLVAFQAMAHRELRPFYDAMRDQDRASIRRARRQLSPPRAPTIWRRVVSSFMEDGVNIAIRSDVDLLREVLRGFHMLEPPTAWLKRPDNLAKVLRYWATDRRTKAAAYPPAAGPDRPAMFGSLGLPAKADMIEDVRPRSRLAASGRAD